MRPRLPGSPLPPLQWFSSPFKKSIRFKLLSVVIVVLVLLTIKNLYLNYWQEMKRSNEQIVKNFSLIADILENDITRWLTNRENEVATMAVNPLVKQYINEITTGSENSVQAGNMLEHYWMEIHDQYGIYDEIYFINKAGEILLSTNPQRKNTFRPRDDLINKPLETGKMYFQDAFISMSTKKPSIAFSVPVRKEGNEPGNDYAGVLVYRIDIDTVLRPLLESRTNLGNTGEVILIDQNKTAITDLRGRPGSALHYNLKSEPALKVVQGEEGIWRGTGYTDKEMISVYRYIPKVRWGIIIRQETSEIFNPLKNQIYQFLLTNILVLIFVLGMLYLVLSRVFQPVTIMAEVAKNISRGDFSRRVKVETKDEIGTLGRNINSMAGELEQQFRLQRCRQDILQSLVSTLDVDELLNKGLNTVCETFDSKVGAIFLVDLPQKLLIRKASYCPGQQLLTQKETINMGEGLEGLAVTTRQLHIITDIPDNTSYSVNWSGGSIKPECIAAVPLIHGTEALGVMSLAFFNKKSIDNPKVQELRNIEAIFGVAINNASTYEQVCDLSYKLQDMNEQLTMQNEELNAQSEELMSQTEELQAQSEELQAQSEELQATTLKLEAQNAELQRVGKEKTKFLATLSHELRAPLNAVISFSDVLLDRVVGEINMQQEKYLHEIMNSGHHLLNLINDLLDLSKIEAGQVELNIREIDPAAPLDEAMAMVSAEVLRKKLEVTNLVKPDVFLVTADQGKIKQVFLNLLSNAVKFTPEGGCITIDARSENKVLYLRVADTGIGIAKEYHETIFEEFKQAANVITGTFGGTGLGLPITRKLLELQGGRIYVESEEGQGATFTVALPMAFKGKCTLPQEFNCDVECLERGKCENCLCSLANLTFMQKPPDKRPLLEQVEMVTCRLAGKSPTLLVVDDDSAVRNYITTILEPRGYKILTAENGKQGVQLALSNKPDLIILDIVMPECNGFEVMDKLSKHSWEKELFLVILTSKDLTPEEKEFLASRVMVIAKDAKRATIK